MKSFFKKSQNHLSECHRAGRFNFLLQLMTVPDFKHISLDSSYFLIILHILYSIYDRSKAEMAKFEHFLGFE